MASGNFVELAKDAIPAQGASNFTTQTSKSLPPSSKEFILVVKPVGSDVKVKLEQSSNNNNWTQVLDQQDENIEATVTDGSTGIIYVDVPLLTYVRVQLGEATSSSTCDVKLHHARD